MVFNTSAADILDRNLSLNAYSALYKQLLYLGVGLIFAYLIRRMGYPWLMQLARPMYSLLVVVLLLVFFPGIGVQVNGAHRWIRLAGLTVQPSEFAKIVLPIFGMRYYKSFWKCAAFLGVAILLVLLEPDNGTVVVLGMTLLVVCFVTGVKMRYWLMPCLALALIAGAAATQLPYVKNRLDVYLHPELDLLGRGHQPYQAKIATGSGGLLGRGVGQSMQKFTYLPEAQNDYIAAIYAEEFGFLGMLGLLILYMVMALLGYSIARRARDENGFYLAVTFTFLLALQAFLNLGVVSGLVPSTGLNLPFFSQGGSSLIANIMAIAIILDVDAKARVDCYRRDRRSPLPRTEPS